MYQFLFRFRYPLALLFILLVLLLVLFQSGRGNESNRLQKILQTVSYPFQSGIHYLVNTIDGWWDGYVMLIGTRQENQQLQDEVAELKERLNQSLENSVQYKRLRGQLLFAKRQPRGSRFDQDTRNPFGSFSASSAHNCINITR